MYVYVCVYLVEVLVALISESDGDGEDGVGGVLVKAGLTISSKQSQSPASAHTHTYKHRTHTQGSAFLCSHVCFHDSLLPEQRQDAAGPFMSDEPGDVMKRLHSDTGTQTNMFTHSAVNISSDRAAIHTHTQTSDRTFNTTSFVWWRLSCFLQHFCISWLRTRLNWSISWCTRKTFRFIQESKQLQTEDLSYWWWLWC